METLNEAFYALPSQKRFPMNTEEVLKSSFGAYKVQKDRFSASQREQIESNFKKAASYYGLELEEPAVKVEPREEIMFKGASECVNMTQITTLDELDKAVDFILTKRASVPRKNLSEAAKYVLWSASNTDVDMNTDKYRKIAHIAGIGVGDRDRIQYELEKRATLIPLSGKNKEAFWKFAKEVKELSDDDFYLEDNLNTVCNTMDDIDFMYNNQFKHASELGYPEDVVFEETIDDLLKEASDLYYVPSVDATMSKKATLERKDAVNSFFQRHFADYEPLDGDKMIEKIASLDENTANALIEAIE